MKPIESGLVGTSVAVALRGGEERSNGSAAAGRFIDAAGRAIAAAGLFIFGAMIQGQNKATKQKIVTGQRQTAEATTP